MEMADLTRLHRYNGWNLLFLILSGILLYMPALRGPLAPIRTPLKDLHIISGILSVVLLLAYLPAARGHWQRLNQRTGQKANVLFLGALLLGWAVTGVMLWINRVMPPGWAEWALIWHDRLTWVAIPWAAAHSATRYYKWRWVRVTVPVTDRRLFLAGAAAFVGALAWGRLGQWLKLPGFDGSQESARVLAAAPATGSHDPLAPGSKITMPAVWDYPTPGARGRFRIYNVTASEPAFDPQTWRFRVGGLVNRSVDLSWQEFLELPRSKQISNFHCITGWSVYDCTWEGVRLSDLLDYAGVKPAATHVKFYSADGVYTDSLPLDVARLPDVILPYRFDGGAVPTKLGGPVRLIVPQMYAYKSVKWVDRIELIDRNHDGYWAVRGYPNDPWLRKGETG